jgi:AraC family transcriptional regulator of adaptative response / DNA-3-methyladenine glycosylase II
VTFFPTATAAAIAGYRPCLRCRPETAPASLIRNGTLNTVNRALRMLESGETDDLAGRLGVSDRHLRRLFREHLGASPRDIEITNRVLLAKSLITDTSLPITDVAFASGFSSIRRFNDAMRQIYRTSPSEIRRRGGAQESSSVTLRLAYLPPYDWARFKAFIEPRLIRGLESLDGNTVSRRLRTAQGVVNLAAEHRPGEHAFHVELELENMSCLREAVERTRTFFDLRSNPELVRAHLAPAMRFPAGLRVPGSWDRFEAAVRAVLGQQVSVKTATTMAARLCDKLGGFPTAEQLANGALNGIGLTSRRASTLQSMAAAVAEGRIRLDSAEEIRRLTEIPGIGAWTAEYIALRCGEPDAFPTGDLVLKKYGSSDAWRPWRSYAAMALWTNEVNK